MKYSGFFSYVELILKALLVVRFFYHGILQHIMLTLLWVDSKLKFFEYGFYISMVLAADSKQIVKSNFASK